MVCRDCAPCGGYSAGTRGADPVILTNDDRAGFDVVRTECGAEIVSSKMN
jgi:hypothetical protein